MRQRTSSSQSPATRVLTAVGVLAAGALIAFAGLSYGGFLRADASPIPRSREGLVKVPRSLKALTALKKVTREDIHDLARGDDSYFWMSQARLDANPDWITNPSDVIGRVLAKDKAADLVFTEKDFLPKGSRTGLSGGVPEGKQGFFVESSKIPGLELLKMGDRFDLLASLPEEAQERPDAEYGLLVGGIRVRGGKPLSLSGVRVLVQDAEMVAVTRGRDMTTQGARELPEANSKSRSTNSQETRITIAIDPKEVVTLTQALAADRAIHCVARSGRQQSSDDAKSLEQKLAGMVAFPATSRPLKAFSRITPDDLADPDTGELRKYYFKTDAAHGEWMTSVNDLVGRVVSRDVSAGYIFSPNDLLPADSAEGISGGVPAGRMALSVDLETIKGLGGLGRGARFDLLASVPFKPGEAFAVLGSSVEVSGGAISQTELNDRARNTVLAEGAMIVGVNEQTATIAVQPSEVAAIAKAITLETSMYVLVRPSGLDPRADVPSELKSEPSPIGRLTVVEDIVGGQRTVRVFAAKRDRELDE